jgi:hypothetical protein
VGPGARAGGTPGDAKPDHAVRAVDALYFAVATLTTTSVSDPDLVLQDGWPKLFKVLYLLVGIGILVERLRRLGIAFVEVRKQERAEPDAPRRGPAAT